MRQRKQNHITVAFPGVHLRNCAPSVTFPIRLAAGVDGIRQLLHFALPHLDWTRYMAFGDPVEDALTLEVSIILAGLCP